MRTIKNASYLLLLMVNDIIMNDEEGYLDKLYPISRKYLYPEQLAENPTMNDDEAWDLLCQNVQEAVEWNMHQKH